jgi:hypothetical protein
MVTLLLVGGLADIETVVQEVEQRAATEDAAADGLATAGQDGLRMAISKQTRWPAFFTLCSLVCLMDIKLGGLFSPGVFLEERWLLPENWAAAGGEACSIKFGLTIPAGAMIIARRYT